MILFAILLVLGVSAVILSTTSLSSVAIANARANATRNVLIQARDALIGRSAANNNRPGSLPCPDTDDDGVAELFAGSACPSYIGRLPWKTLGLPDLRDSDGERLWYMLSTRFRDNSAVEPLNSDTKGNITVYLGSTGTVQTSEAVAVIFSPGPVVSGQVRDATTNAACAAPSGTIATSNCAANYLETASGVNNASGTGPYIAAQATDTFNDVLLVITTAELMTSVEKRVAAEILTLLRAYKNSGTNWCTCYPYADISDGKSNNNNYSGRVPLVSAQDPSIALTPDWDDVGITTTAYPALAWLRNNQWWWVFFYAVASSQTELHSGGSLTVDGVSGKSVVLITTGPADSGRPIASASWSDPSDWAYYVDDSNNSDMGTNYSTPSSAAYARDRLYTF